MKFDLNKIKTFFPDLISKIKNKEFPKNPFANKTKKEIIKLLLKSAVAIAIFALFIVCLFSPVMPKLVYDLCMDFNMSAVNTNDNGISDYYKAELMFDGADDFAISLLPDIPEGYSAFIDWLRMLNRNHGVTKIVVNLSPEATELLNQGLSGTLNPEFYTLSAGTFYASVEFKQFCSELRTLNSVILPKNRLSFVGIAGDPASAYKEITSEYATCLLMSRDEAHSSDGIGKLLIDSGARFILTDILYSQALTSYDTYYSDIYRPLLAKGVHVVYQKNMSFLCDYYSFFSGKTSSYEDGFSYLTDPSGDLFLLIKGKNTPADAETEEN